jgi:hypothetical protein
VLACCRLRSVICTLAISDITNPGLQARNGLSGGAPICVPK